MANSVLCQSQSDSFLQENEMVSLKTRLLSQQNQPVVLHGLINSWSASSWTPETLTEILKDKPIQFRIGKQCDDIQWETKCSYEMATAKDFQEWLRAECIENNPLAQYDRTNHWCYADYKYMNQLFDDSPAVMQSIDWSTLGFEDRDGRQSTFWLGSKAAYTVCHQDTYGCNIIAQIYGRKRWVLFPPGQGRYLYPTRLPYEESSVFSTVDVKNPDLAKQPMFRSVTPAVVILEPGDVMFLPRHWWHFVESLDTTVSVNSWIPMDVDNEERLLEAISRTLVLSLMGEDKADINDWLNPTDEYTDHEQNMKYVNQSLQGLERTSRPLCPEKLSESGQEVSGNLGTQNMVGHKETVNHPNTEGNTQTRKDIQYKGNEYKRIPEDNVILCPKKQKLTNEESLSDNTSAEHSVGTGHSDGISREGLLTCKQNTVNYIVNKDFDRKHVTPVKLISFDDYIKLVNHKFHHGGHHHTSGTVHELFEENTELVTSPGETGPEFATADLLDCLLQRDVLELVCRKIKDKRGIMS